MSPHTHLHPAGPDSTQPDPADLDATHRHATHRKASHRHATHRNADDRTPTAAERSPGDPSLLRALLAGCLVLALVVAGTVWAAVGTASLARAADPPPSASASATDSASARHEADASDPSDAAASDGRETRALGEASPVLDAASGRDSAAGDGEERPAIRVRESAVALTLDGRTPVDAAESFAVGDEVIVWLSVVNEGSDSHVELVFAHEGRERWRVDLDVGHSRRGWRTWARKKIRSADVGEWEVTVLGPDGNAIHTVTFSAVADVADVTEATVSPGS